MAKTVKRRVTHPQLYLMVDGKMAHMPKGKVIDVSAETADRLKNKLEDIDLPESTQTGGNGEANAKLADELTKAKAEVETLKAELAKTKPAK